MTLHWGNVYSLSFSPFHEYVPVGLKLKEVGKEKVHQVLCVGTVIALHFQIDECITGFFRDYVCCKSPLDVLNGASYIQKVQEIRPRKRAMAQGMSWPSAFRMQLYLHVLVFFKECMQTKLVCTAHNCSSGMQLGYAVQLVMKAWNTCMCSAGIRE